MSWRIIKIATHSKISLNQNQLIYEAIDSGERLSFPIEDIATLILESLQINITSALLSKLTDFGVAIITCNPKHRPNGILVSYAKPTKQTETVFAQTEMSQPLQKRLWQKIIQQKILNQADVLPLSRETEAHILAQMSKRVLSGDSGFQEAAAAQLYWKSLFGSDFVRHNEDGINAALNYGYAIVRNTLIENIAVSGLIGCLGVHHHSILNNFNLADDLIEPYRAFVDQTVLQIKPNPEDELSKTTKETLIALLQNKCVINQCETSILNAAQQTVFSFMTAIKEKDADKLLLPEFVQ
jgi:CRISPR-associated protein Cas1